MEKKRTYGVWAVRSSTSIFGPAQSWCKENGKPLEFDTKAAAENYAKERVKSEYLRTDKGNITDIIFSQGGIKQPIQAPP